MTKRALFGNLGDGTFGFRCSRPGFDVTTATKGQMLYDTSAVVFQKVLSGETIIAMNRTDRNFDVIGPPLPAEYASYSNLHMWANFYEQIYNTGSGTLYSDTDLTLDTDGVDGSDFRYGVENGVIKFTAINCPVTGPWNSTFQWYVKSSWAVFNALMS